MTTVFLSYSRTESRQVSTLADHLRTGGYAFWYDRELTGGQSWWNEVLRQILECDVFIPVVSERFLSSVACQRELEYAVALGKPLLPVMVEAVPPRFLGPILGQVQWLDYRAPTLDSALRLMASLRGLPPPMPRPAQLPPPPPVPVSYLDTLKARVETPAELRRPEQIQLLADLKDRLGGDEMQDVRRLLETLRARPDLIVSVRQEIDDLLRRIPASAGPTALAQPPTSTARTSSVVKVGLFGCAALAGLVMVLVVMTSMCSAIRGPTVGTLCYTIYGTCPLFSAAPVGAGCVCANGASGTVGQ